MFAGGNETYIFLYENFPLRAGQLQSTTYFSPVKVLEEQECIPVGCVPPAAVAVGGVSTRHPPLGPGTPPGPCTPPEPCTSRDHAPPGTMHPLDHAPLGPCTPPRAGTPCGQTDACKHITLPQTSLAGGN